MQKIKLFSAAWHGDREISLHFPDAWEITLLGNREIPALSTENIRQAIQNPTTSLPLRELAKNASQVAIILDDITRPTPTAQILPWLIEELKQGGLNNHSILIVIGVGSHTTPTDQEIINKIGMGSPADLPVLVHDCRDNLSFLGKTRLGTPLYINQTVLDCDLRIGVGSIYPHPSAGFSGGAKSLIPSVCGIKTIRYLHNHLISSTDRAGSLDTEFRQEIEGIASRIGLHFVVNAVLNQGRQIGGVFAGDYIKTHLMGIAYAANFYRVEPVKEADIVIADQYPFDTELQFAFDRGFWPLFLAKAKTTRIALGAFPKGIGSHALYPLSMPLFARYFSRMKELTWRDIKTIHKRIQKNRTFTKRKAMPFILITEGISQEEFSSIFPNGRVYPSWKYLLHELEKSYSQAPVRVVIYRCAPFLFYP